MCAIPNYWARDLNVRRGMFNFDRITFKIYKDNTAQTEAFKAGEFDLHASVLGPRLGAASTPARSSIPASSSRSRASSIAQAGDFQSYLINTRRDKFKDRRVREAMGLAFDFEWMNQQLFQLATSACADSSTTATSRPRVCPAADELALLEPLRAQAAAEIFDRRGTASARTDPPSSLRDNLRKAQALLEEAGWTYRDGALRNAKGEAFTVEFLDSAGGERTTTTATCAGTGQARASRCVYRTRGFRAHPEAAGRLRLRPVHSRAFPARSPGNELLDRFGSQVGRHRRRRTI